MEIKKYRQFPLKRRYLSFLLWLSFQVPASVCASISFAKGVPFESSEQTIFAVIGGIPLISDRM